MQHNPANRPKGQLERSRRSSTSLSGHVYEPHNLRRKELREVRSSWKDPPKMWKDHIRMQSAAKDWLTSQTEIRQKLKNLLPAPKMKPKTREDVGSRDMNYDSIRRIRVKEITLKRIRQADYRHDGTVSLDALAKAFDIPMPKRTRAATSMGILERNHQKMNKMEGMEDEESEIESVSTRDQDHEPDSHEDQLTWEELQDVFQAFDLDRSGRIKIEDFLKFVYSKPARPDSLQTSRISTSSTGPKSARPSSSSHSIFDPTWERALYQLFVRNAFMRKRLDFSGFIACIKTSGIFDTHFGLSITRSVPGQVRLRHLREEFEERISSRVQQESAVNPEDHFLTFDKESAIVSNDTKEEERVFITDARRGDAADSEEEPGNTSVHLFLPSESSLAFQASPDIDSIARTTITFHEFLTAIHNLLSKSEKIDPSLIQLRRWSRDVDMQRTMGSHPPSFIW
mmetsp:Transcript_12354/g.43013  ORF Transcript_12354/g.43013 Transcript_12354/m.43013 type:complete len:455 (-) Transcript_12354:261-1625(-)